MNLSSVIVAAVVSSVRTDLRAQPPSPHFVARLIRPISALPWAVLAAALLGTFVATWQSARAAEARADARFRMHAAEMAASMQAKIDLYLLIVRSGAGLFIASEHVEPEEFMIFASPIGISEHFQGVRSIAAVPRVPRASLAAFEEGLSRFHQREVKVWPQREAEEYFPLAVAAPMDEEKLISIGFDLASDPARNEALQLARDLARATASSPIDIVEISPTPRRGFLIAIPLYGSAGDEEHDLLGPAIAWPPPDDLEDRRERLRGFLVAAVLIHEMVDAVRIRYPGQFLPMTIYDGDEPTEDSMLYRSARAGDLDRSGVTERLDVAGRVWTIHFFDPHPSQTLAAWLGIGPRADGEARLVPIIGIVGLIFSSLLFIVTRAQVRARSAAEVAANEALKQRAAAAESERRFRALADAAPVIIWMVGTNGEVVWVNRAGVDFFGRSLEDVLGHRWLEIVHEEDRERVTSVHAEAVAERRPVTQELRARRHDGEYRWLMATGRPVFRSLGDAFGLGPHARPHGRLPASDSFAGYVGTAMDVTDQRLAMERLHEQARELESVNLHLERLNTELARSNAELSDFASIAAHDLKEPLRGMGNYARFVREDFSDQLDPQGRDMLETIERLAARLSRLLDSLMEYARVGRGELHIEETDLNEVCRGVNEDLSMLLSEPNTEVVCRPLPHIPCDPILAAQVFSNLLSNALKYNTSVPRQAEIGVLESGNGPIFYVRDNGIGIPAQHHDRIFKMFKRLHTREAFGGGLGAGLAIVKKIVERHGGRIWIASEVGRGTTFYFTLTPQAPKTIPAESQQIHA